MVRPMTRAKS